MPKYIIVEEEVEIPTPSEPSMPDSEPEPEQEPEQEVGFFQSIVNWFKNLFSGIRFSLTWGN